MAINLTSLRELDINEMPWWPKSWQWGVFGLIAIVVLGLAYYFVLADDWQKYQLDKRQETALKSEFQLKYFRAVNLPVYREQLDTLERKLGDMLNMLPTDDETPRLLDDVTLIGTQAGLRIERIQWEAPLQRELYTALPIRMDLVGRYHQLGDFIGDVANLNRIISVKDFTLEQTAVPGLLRLKLTAETYRQQTLQMETKP